MMRLPFGSPVNTVLFTSLLFPTFIFAVGTLDCKQIVTDDKVWNFSELGGPRSVVDSKNIDSSLRNTTYTIDICNYLRRPGDVEKSDKCPGSTRVCAIEHTIETVEGKDGVQDKITKVIPIAGELMDTGGGHLDAKYQRLRTSELDDDKEKEGLRIELSGGFYGKPKRAQKAVIDFLCDSDRTGTETDLDPDYKSSDTEETPKNDASSLEFVAYDKESPGTDVDILRLNWYTKHACEDQTDNDDAGKGAHWGFFTWFLIIGFLVTAAYLIFGSWLNYNRYGARGWDLLPHGDTIRDVPYLFKDWTRRVVNTVQGGGSRGGYSAV